MATRGRPKKEIDIEQFKKLCGLHCTCEEIAGFFECSDETIQRFCKMNFQDDNGKPMTFGDVFKKYSAAGKISLRRMQWHLAEKSASMAIWLGKQYLGQKDIDVSMLANANNGIIESILALEKQKNSDRVE